MPHERLPRTVPPFSEFFFKKIVHKLGRFSTFSFSLLFASHPPFSAFKYARSSALAQPVLSSSVTECPRWRRKKKNIHFHRSISLFDEIVIRVSLEGRGGNDKSLQDESRIFIADPLTPSLSPNIR